MKKRLCMLLAVLILLLTLAPTTVMAVPATNLTIRTANTADLKVGDTFTVTLGNNAMTVSSFTGGIHFDTTCLTCSNIVKNSGYTNLANRAAAAVCSTAAEANKTGYIGVGFAQTAEDTYAAADIITVTFQVLKAGSIQVSGYENSDGTDHKTVSEDSDTLRTEQIEATAASTGGGCYVATCVYGSYDCPEVWTLRRFRDETLAQTWYGRAFIHTYYAISPTIVKWFGDTDWFKNMWRGPLDKMVANLNAQGVPDTPYDDIDW